MLDLSAGTPDFDMKNFKGESRISLNLKLIIPKIKLIYACKIKKVLM